ncbi:MAG: hypothetical protein AABZ74_10630 [Cyanobacteriota bacterium]
MEIPRSIQTSPVDTTKTVVPAKTEGVQTPKTEDVAVKDTNFADGLKSELKTTVEKGALPSEGVKFEEPPVQETPKTEIKNQISALFDGKPALSFTLEDPKLPELQTSEWKGYNTDVNTSVANAFEEKTAKKIPVISSSKVSALLKAMGANKVEDLQGAVGAKADNQFGPETYFKTKNHVSGQINQVKSVDDMNKISSMLGLMGKDPQVDQMKTVLTERIKITQDFTSTKEGLNNYFNDVNGILAQANPQDLDSLNNASQKLGESFTKLPDNIKGNSQAVNANTEASARVNQAIATLKGDLEKSKQAYGSEVSCIADESVNNALTTGDKGKLDEGKGKINGLDANFAKIKDSDEAKAAKQGAFSKMDDAGAKIDSIKALNDKKEWSPEETTKAQDLAKGLPDGKFKADFGKSIDSHIAAAKLKAENKSNLETTTKTGLHDVVGNGFWNLENKDGVKSMFQLVAKQGLLPDAMKKMNVEDQTRAINTLTKDASFDPKSQTSSDKFNIDIAKSIFQNLSSVANVDKEVKNSSKLKDAPSASFDNHALDSKSYVQGLKFSIGSDRIGSEREAALTMIRGVMNGEAPKEVLPALSRYEIHDVSKYLEKNGKNGEKDQFLGTISQAYNNGQSINIDSLGKGDKAKIIKNVMDTNQETGKVSDLLKKSGKSVVLETVKSQNLSDAQLSTIGKSSNAGDLVSDAGVSSKVLTSMIKTYNKQDGSVKLEDIKKFIDQSSKSDWDAENNVKTMKTVLGSLGDGKDSDYAKFQTLSPATLDRIRDIARSNPYQNNY